MLTVCRVCTTHFQLIGQDPADCCARHYLLQQLLGVVAHLRCRLRSCRASASAAAAISSLVPVVAAAAAGLRCFDAAVDSRRASREACEGVENDQQSKGDCGTWTTRT